MPGRIAPEPRQPDRDPEHLAEERELARSARLAGLAVQRAAARRPTPSCSEASSTPPAGCWTRSARPKNACSPAPDPPGLLQLTPPIE
jgi:hypothetical protein